MSVNGEEKPVTEEEEKREVAKEPTLATDIEEKKPEEKKEENSPAHVETKVSVENGEVKTCAGAGDSSSVSSTASGGKPEGFKERFQQFSKFGDSKSDGKMITLSQSDKWMKQAKVIDKKITTTDTAICFKKYKLKKIPLSEYEKFLKDLAQSKHVELEEMKKKMTECGPPGFTGLSGSGAKNSPSTVERLTDTSKYTGSHKQRFDDSGKGKGISGRKDLPDKSGYVQGYQNKDSYNKTH